MALRTYSRLKAQNPETRSMSEYTRRSYIALGICVIAAEFLLESSIAHHFNPNPLSPVVWSVLGAVVAASLVSYLRLRAKAKKHAEGNARAE